MSDGLDLYISSPEIYGEKIRCIVKTNNGWAVEVYTTSNKLADQFFYGELRFLSVYRPISQPKIVAIGTSTLSMNTCGEAGCQGK